MTSSMKYSMFQLVIVFVLPILKIIDCNTGTSENQNNRCVRFETLEVLRQFRWEITPVPWTIAEAKATGWNKAATDSEYSLDLYRYKEVNNLFIFFYKGNLAGVGPVFEAENIQRAGEYKKAHPKSTSWWHFGAATEEIEATEDYIGNGGYRYMYYHLFFKGSVAYNYAMILFLDPNILKENKPDPCTQGQIFFEGSKKGDWIEVKTNPASVMPPMNKQGCLEKYGNFFFYKLDSETKCEDIHGFFSFYDDKENLSGFGAFYQDNSELAYVDEHHPNPVYRFYNIAMTKEMVPFNAKCISGNEKKMAVPITAIVFYIKPRSIVQRFVCKPKKHT